MVLVLICKEVFSVISCMFQTRYGIVSVIDVSENKDKNDLQMLHTWIVKQNEPYIYIYIYNANSRERYTHYFIFMLIRPKAACYLFNNPGVRLFVCPLASSFPPRNSWTAWSISKKLDTTGNHIKTTCRVHISEGWLQCHGHT